LFSADGRMLYSAPGCAVADLAAGLADGRPLAVELLGPEGREGAVLVRLPARLEHPKDPPGSQGPKDSKDLKDSKDSIELTALGRHGAVLRAAGRSFQLSPRHSEIVVALALAGHGMTGDRLAVELSEQELHSSTVRAEMTRLRAVLGPELLGSRPYTLARPVRSDFGAVRDLVAQGHLVEAMRLYAGPLLPSSQAPVVVEHRRALEQQLRGALLAGGDPVLLRRWVDSEWGSGDAPAWRALADRLPGGSAQRAAAAARARTLTAETQVKPVAAVLQRSRF
jgi:hypothetical protein